MKNSSINSMSYSNRAQSPEFCGLFKQKQQKVTVKNLIWTVVFLVLTIVGVAAISALNGYLDTNVDSSAAAIGIVVAFAAIPVFGIIFLVNCIKTVFSAVFYIQVRKKAVGQQNHRRTRIRSQKGQLQHYA